MNPEDFKRQMAKNNGWWVALRNETKNPYTPGTPENKAFTEGYRERRRFDAKTGRNK